MPTFLRAVLALAIGLAPIAETSWAQSTVVQAVPEARCFYASISFSAGAEVAIGTLRYECTADAGVGTWVPSASDAVPQFCIYSSELFGLGAVAGTGDAKVRCQPDGAWAP